MKSRLTTFHLLGAGLALALFAGARAEDPTTIKFSEPSKPGTLKILIGRGDLRVQGADTAEVVVKTEAKPVTNKPRKDGLRVITASAGYSLTERDNVVTLDALSDGWKGGGSDFQITVPRNTSLVVQNSWGGDITCTGISGDIELNSMNGEIRLEDVSGGVVVQTMNGEIRASVLELREGKPLSFTSMNGEVIVRVPDNAKANVRLRTQNGSVLTDFDESVLVTKAETTAVSRARTTSIKSTRVIGPEIQQAIREAAEVSATAVKEALEAVKDGLEAARVDSDEARRHLDEARREIDRARRETERERRVASTRTVRGAEPAAPPATAAPGGPTPAAAPRPPTPPKVPIPTITGGKLVTGTLNGGGPEISVATMNGDVTLRKLDRK